VKKILYSLRCGIIGFKQFSKTLFRNYLTKNIKHLDKYQDRLIYDDKCAFFVLFKSLPFRLELSFYENEKEFIEREDYRSNFDILFFLIDIKNLNYLEELKKNYWDLRNSLEKNIMYILITVTPDRESLTQIPDNKIISVSKELNFLYCFLLIKQDPELDQLLTRILNDFKFQFKYSSPELFERARFYGKKMREDQKPFLDLF